MYGLTGGPCFVLQAQQDPAEKEYMREAKSQRRMSREYGSQNGQYVQHSGSQQPSQGLWPPPGRDRSSERQDQRWEEPRGQRATDGLPEEFWRQLPGLGPQPGRQGQQAQQQLPPRPQKKAPSLSKPVAPKEVVLPQDVTAQQLADLLGDVPTLPHLIPHIIP
jgi:hypothetical protein